MAEALRQLSSRPAAVARGRLLRLVPPLALILFLGPLAAGLSFTLLPAFGWLPSIGGSQLGLAPWRALLDAPELPGALRLTCFTGFASTLISLLLAIGFAASWHETRLFTALRRSLSPLLAVPHAALALGLAFLIAPSGWIVRLVAQLLLPWDAGWQTPPDLATLPDPYGLTLVLGLVLKETPYLLLMIVAALGQVPASRSLAVARSLGYGPVTAWIKVVLPQLYPQIRLPVFAVLAYALSVVDMAIILAPATPPPLAVLVTRWFADPDLTRRFAAAAGATLQAGLVATGIAALVGIERALSRFCRPFLADGRRGGSGSGMRRFYAGALATLVLLAGLAMLGMAIWSVAARWRYPDVLPSGVTLDSWMRHAVTDAWPLAVTVVVALVAAGIALALVLGCLENEQRHGVHPTARALWLLYLPLLVPQVSFLFGFQVMLAMVDLDGTWPGLVWAHLLFVLPYMFLTLADPWRALDERYARSALCLGASPARVFWRIKLPMLLRPVLFAVAVGVAVSVAQYLATLFAGAGRFATLTTEAVTLSAGGDRRVIGVYAVLQSVIPLALFAAAMALSARRRAAPRAQRARP